MSRKWGQHFLINQEIIRRIVDYARISSSDEVLEIGPGRGELTAHYARQAKKSVLLEIDPVLAQRLRDRWPHQYQLEVINQDALEIDWASLGWSGVPVVLGNLPYYISKPLVTKLIKWGGFSRAVLMLQEEVVRRLAASPGESDYGMMTVLFRLRASARILFLVGKKEFRPPPAVGSAVILIEPRVQVLPDGLDEAWLAKVVKAAFLARRQKMINSLSRQIPSIKKNKIFDAMREASISDGKRAQEVPPESFIVLAQKLRESAL